MIRKSHKKSVLFALAGAGASLASLAVSATSAMAQTNPNAYLLDKSDGVTIGGAGGNKVQESPDTYLWAPISGFCICAGDYLDGIQFHYGRVAGKMIGSSGGNCSLRTLYSPYNEPAARQHIKSIDVRAGNYIDGLKISRSKDAYLQVLADDWFGGQGGNVSSAVSRNGGYLAYVEGSGGNYVDSLRFVFAPKEYFDGFGQMPETGPKPQTANRSGCVGFGCVFFGDGLTSGNTSSATAAKYSCMLEEGSRTPDYWYSGPWGSYGNKPGWGWLSEEH